MKLQSTNWNQKQFVDQASAAPDNNKEGWHKIPFKPGKECQIEGRNYQIIGKMERHLPIASGGRIGGIALGILCTIATLGLAPLFSKQVRQLFTGRQVQVVVQEVLQNKGANPPLGAGKVTPKVDDKKADTPPKVVTFENATDSTPFPSGYDLQGWEAFQADMDFAENCCSYPRLATYIANKHGKNINQVCGTINNYMATLPKTAELPYVRPNDILPLLP